MLACMREILLRKTGMWANHTQMLDLIYASLYNNDSLLHQVRTGQGKSIITMMRAAYLAYNGSVVDIFSSKESLSKRDREKCSKYLNSMGIRNSYITPHASPQTYLTNDSKDNIGVVNFATIGNNSLYQASQIWHKLGQINVDPKLRVAFIDEADFLLKFENTQFNYSASSDSDSVYNFDAWVYSIVHNYYQKNKDRIKNANAISSNTDLQAICALIQKEARNAPKQSTFVSRYIIPAVNNNPDDVKKRNEKLKQLLVAAHVADGLLRDQKFSIRSEQRVFANGSVVNCRIAKVLIDSQIKEGSTYSDLVQQFLHVKLNEEAIKKGEPPNFFIEPESQIALSSNAKYILKKYYHKIEGCTGTAGNQANLDLFDKVYTIKHVVKVPTHEKTRTKFMGVIYCDGEQAQITEIVAKLKDNPTRPILITCANDTEVKRLSKLVMDALGSKASKNVIVDTNDQGKSESEILPIAGLPGKITFSSRMGRGTDLTPTDPNHGLMVIRTYPAVPEIVKQELGRQGRNGADGCCIDIIDYRGVLKDYNLYQRNPEHKKRFAQIMEQQRIHLDEKLKKHKSAGSDKWDWLKDDKKLQEKYLITRCVQELKDELQKKSEINLRRKEYLLASLSGEIIDALQANYTNKHFNYQGFEEDWLVLRNQIESLWNVRLAGRKADSEETYAAFLSQVSQLWDNFCYKHNNLDTSLLKNLASTPAAQKALLEGNNEELSTFLQEEIKRLSMRDDNSEFNAEERTKLIDLQKTLKKKMLLHHPDKRHVFPTGSDTVYHLLYDLYERIGQQIGAKTEYSEEESKVLVEAGKGALIPYKPNTLKSEKTLPAVTQFYQHWLSGVEKHCLTSSQGVKQTLFGINNIQVERFFQTIYQTSCTTQHRNWTAQHINSLFTHLAQIKQPQMYLVPVQHLDAAIKDIKNKARDPDYGHYLEGIKAFFAQEWLENKRPFNADLADLEKIGFLFSLSFKINTSLYVATKQASTQELINTLCSCIYKQFWNQLDGSLVHALNQIFSSVPEITKLFAHSVFKQDLPYFIQLINENKSNPQALNTLVEYLKQHAQELSENPSVLRPLFQITLNSPKPTYLPNPKLFAHLPDAYQGAFWHFMAQRKPLIQKDIERLVGILDQGSTSPQFNVGVFSPLMNLPPHIDIDYIAQHIERVLSQSNLAQAFTTTRIIQEASTSFTAFAHQRGLIQSDKMFHATQKEYFNKFLVLFNTMPPERATVLFTLFNEKRYNIIPLDAFYSICSKTPWTENAIDHISKCLEQRRSIEKAPKEYQNTLKLIWDDNVSKSITTSRLQEFIDKIKNITIEESLFTYIAQKWTKQEISSSELLDASLHFFHNAKQYSFTTLDLKQLYEKVKNPQQLDELGTLLQVVGQLPNALKTFVSSEITRLSYNPIRVKRLLHVINKTQNVLLEEERRKDIIRYYYEKKLDDEELDVSIAYAQTELKNHTGYDSGTSVIYPKWVQLDPKPMDLLPNYAELFPKINAYTQRYKEDEYPRLFHLDLVKLQPWLKFKGYLEAFLAQEKIKDAKTVHSIYDLWFNNTIKGPKELAETVRLVNTAENMTNWDAYFGSFTKNRKQREGIMRLVHQGVIQTQSIVIKCYNEYAQLIQREITPPQLDAKMTVAQRRHELTSKFKKIVHFTQEISSIQGLSDKNGYTNDLPKNTHGSFFSTVHDAYKGERWVAGYRKNQARLLFADLEGIDRNAADYYEQCLDRVWTLQSEIISTDAGKNRNTKGYSRLYDSTLQISIRLCSDFLSDQTISLKEKMNLKTKLEKQFNELAKHFYNLLPVAHPQRHLFHGYQSGSIPEKGSTKEGAIYRAITELDRDTIPKDLQYLVTNLECYVDLLTYNGEDDLTQQYEH